MMGNGARVKLRVRDDPPFTNRSNLQTYRKVHLTHLKREAEPGTRTTAEHREQVEHVPEPVPEPELQLEQNLNENHS